jgi:3-mercaptopyruvate sulfurtransferase SseA
VIWIEWNKVLVEDGTYKDYWKPAEEVKKVFSARGITPDKDIYIY